MLKTLSTLVRPKLLVAATLKSPLVANHFPTDLHLLTVISGDLKKGNSNERGDIAHAYNYSKSKDISCRVEAITLRVGVEGRTSAAILRSQS